MNYLTLKIWLRRQRSFWQLCHGRAEIYRRWPTLKLTEPVSWSHDDIGAIVIGDQISIGPFSEIFVQASQIESKISGSLSIGDRTWIGAAGNIRAAGGRIVIGKDCLIAQQVSLIASNHNTGSGLPFLESGWDEAKTGITIGNNVWIGCGVVVLPGCQIGDNAVVGAGSVVTKSIPSGAIWAGNPAKALGSRG